MKTIIVIFCALWMLKIIIRIVKNDTALGKIWNEALLLTEVRQNIDDTSLVKGLIMNSIRSRAAEMLLQGKIREQFYKVIFGGGDEVTPWWEVNRENIMSQHLKEKLK